MSSLRDRRSTPLTAALLFSMVAAQLLGAIHFLLIPHTVVFSDRISVRCVHHHDGEGQGANGNDHQRGDDSDDSSDCRLHALLAQVKIHTFAVGTPDIWTRSPSEPDSPALPEDHRGQTKIYRVSPSNSPPSAV